MIFVVTPVHNRREVTRRFLQCLRNQSYKDFEAIVVDDGSTDGTCHMIQNDFNDVTLLTGDGTLWWTGGTNKGLTHVLDKAKEDDYVLIINDDVVIGPEYIDRLHTFACRHPRSLVGSVIVDVDAPEIISDGGRIRNWITAKKYALNAGEPLSSFPDTTFYPVSQLTGRGMLAPVRVFREIGLYDAKRFRHRGDTEWPVRAQKNGYQLLIYYGAVVASHRELTHPTERGQFRLSDFRRYFFDFRSSGSISYRYHFARASSVSIFQFASFFVCDIARTMIHFFRHCEYPSFRIHSVSTAAGTSEAT